MRLRCQNHQPCHNRGTPNRRHVNLDKIPYCNLASANPFLFSRHLLFEDTPVLLGRPIPPRDTQENFINASESQ